MPIITLSNVSVSYGDIFALEDVSFELEKWDYIGLIGPNGAGKSTLLKILLGSISPNKWDVTINSDVRFGYVSQNYLLDNFFSISVKEILEMWLNRMSCFRKKWEEKVFIEKLSIVGLDKSFLKKSFHDLSGWQKQRVIIARSLLQSPNVLLFDEPLSWVDYTAKVQIYKLLAQINKKYETAIIFVSHEIESIVTKCKRILCLNKKLHEGCHPIDFMHWKLKSCSVSELHTSIHPIHHHHNNT